jgi:G3E family GTPase
VDFDRRINPTALFRRTLRSDIDVQDVFGIGSYGVNKDLDLDGVLGRLDTGSNSRRDPEKGEEGHEHDESCGHGDHAGHLDGIGSIVLTIPVISETTLDRLESFLQAVHWDSKFPSPVTTTTDSSTDDVPSTSFGTNENGSGEEETFEILRTKGLFPTHSGKLYVLQGVRDIFELNRLGDKREGKDKVEEGKLVLIGRKLGDRGKWEEELRGWLGL